MGTRPRPQHEPAYRRMCKLLKQWRIDAELTQRDLGRKLRRPHTFVHKTETGDRRIDPVEFVKWCRACGMEPDEGIRQVAAR